MNGNKSQDSASCVENVSKELIVSSRGQVIKNLIVICIGFILLFTAYNGLSMLQSTMNQSEGIGVASQSIIYAGFCVSALLLPKYTLKKLGCKRALLISMSCYVPYVAANFYFNWFTMVPSAILVGLAASVLWSSNCTYLSKSAEHYSDIIIRSIHDKDEHFNGSDATANCSDGKKIIDDFSISKENDVTLKYETLNCKTLENLDVNHDSRNNSATSTNNFTVDAKALDLAKDSSKYASESEINKYNKSSTNSKVLHNTYMRTDDLKISVKQFQKDANYLEEHSKAVSSITARFFGFAGLAIRSSDIWSNLMSYYVLQDNIILDNITESGNCSCGASFCNVESNCFEHNLAEPTPQMRYILTGVSVALSILAVLLVYLFLDDIEAETERESVKFSCSLALATCKFARKKKALLLLPLSAYIGLQQGFYIGDFTKSYIACAWGVYHVGLVTVSYGIVSGLSSTAAGLMVKYVGRIPVMLVGGVINAGINIYLLIWNPLPNQATRFIVSAALWGMAVGILWSQLRGFYGVVFKTDTEAAFAGFYLWDSIGYCLAFSYSNYICTNIKLYILLVVSTIGIIGYVRAESLYRHETSKSKE